MRTDRRSLKILFSMRHPGSFRMYESPVRLLAARGHRVHIVIDRGERLGWHDALEQLMADCPNVTWGWSAAHPRTIWFGFSRFVRIWLDYLRYFDASYAAAPILRQRAAEQMPAALARITGTWPIRTAPGLSILRRVLRAAERALPRVRALDESIREDMPDVMLFTPLVYLGSPQLEMLRSARALGIRTVLCVGSWDHLSSKALIRDVPHRVFVWNETQKREAIELHCVPPERLVVTGAQCYDQWFGRQPSRSREAFCERVGLRPDRPFVLWVCSALFHGSPSEAALVASWIDSLRRSGAEDLRGVGVLIRPHPARRHEWEEIDLRSFDNVTLYGSMPADEESKNDYFDSLYYSSAVAGLNTSAFLEAAIVGRPVHAILPPDFHDNQEGTLHFHYLLTVGGGLLHAARDLPTHHAQLQVSLAGSRDGAKPAFVEAFIRPLGLEVPASDVFAREVESLAAAPAPEPVRDPALSGVLRAALRPVAAATHLALGRRLDGEDKTSREIRGALVKDARARARERKRRQLEESRRQLQQQREREKAEATARRAAAKTQHRLDREQLVAADRRRKAEARGRRERAKQLHHRRKRLGALRERIMHKLGLA